MKQSTKYSKRGLQALKRIGEGDTIDQAADNMHIARSTTEKNLAKIKKQLNARTLYHAVYLATKSGLIVAIFTVSISSVADFERRRVSQRRREQYDFLLIPTMV